MQLRHRWWLTAALFFFLGLGPNFGAQARGPAGAYELAHRYFGAFRGLVKTYGPGQTRYLPKAATLQGSHKDGGLNFIEFAKLVSGKDIPDKLIPKDFDLDNPDPHKAANLLMKAGLTGTIQTSKLVPKGIFTKPTPGWIETIQYESKIVNEVKRTQIKNGQRKDWDDTEKKLKTCTSEILLLRRSDIAAHTVATLEKELGVKIVVTEEPYSRDPNGQKKIVTIEPEKTIEAAQRQGVTITRDRVDVAIKKHVQPPEEGESDSGYRHQQVVEAVAASDGDLGKVCE